MKSKVWVRGFILGLLLGGCIGIAQFSLLEKPKYIASVILSERAFFNEYWESAPDVLVKAELKRVELSSRDPNEGSRDEAILGDLLNEWFRLLDETLFRFPIDGALKSNSIGDEIKRYAKVQRGVVDGLNQRSIIFRAVGPGEERVENNLRDWVAEVQMESEELAAEAIKSWLRRKAMSLKVLSEDGGFDLSSGELARVDIMAESFERAAEAFPMISPYHDELSEVSVVNQPQQKALRVLIWALAGSLLSIVIVAGFRVKKT